jgi:TonB-linked SusC/RagA family outer membrane protein
MNVSLPLKQGLIVLLLFTAMVVKAQTGSVSGRVLDETGQGLPGASVVVKGTTRSTAADAKGNYQISGLQGGSLVLSASFVGYITLEKTAVVSESTLLNFNLVPDAQKLTEVVVIGYGTTTKKNLTGAVSTVTAKDFQKGAITSPDQLIQGKVAGVTIIPGGGQPGSAGTIRIRGGASLNASNNPLYVIDGIPLSGEGISGSASQLSLINPNDIESFTVLKDANATAIYGSRASNGVILITTKKGGGALPVFNFSTNNSYATVAKKVNVLSADQVRAYVNGNGTDAAKALLGTANTDWQDEIYNNAFGTDNNLSLSGTFKKVPYRISAGYLDQKGLLMTDWLKRGTGGIRLTPSLFDDHLKVDLNLKGSISNSRFANQLAVPNAIAFDPTQSVHADNQYGNYFEWTSGNVPNVATPRNPVSLLEQYTNYGKADRSFGNLQLDYSFHFLPELHANVNIGYDVAKGQGQTDVPAPAAYYYLTKGYSLAYLGTQQDKFMEAYLNYTKTVESINSNFNITAGYGYYDNSKKNYFLPTYNALGQVQSIPNFPFEIQRNKLLSYYGRFVYTLAGKYILSGTIRADGSSKFNPDGRWGYFPSGGFTWRVKDEAFLKNSKVVSDLKIRLSYGETGNKDVPVNYAYLANYNLGADQAQYQLGDNFYHLYSPLPYDKNLRWESTTTYNGGLDYGFLDGRIYGSIDVYYKKTKDLLATIEIPIGTNFSNQLLTNVGNMENRGIEASINVALLKGDQVNWDIGFNFAYNKNKVSNLTLNNNPNYKQVARGITGGIDNYIQYHAVGLQPYAFFLYKQVYDASGSPLEGVYEDLTGDGRITEDDRRFYKSPAPVYVMGFNTSFNYRKWTLSTVLRSNIGAYIYDNVSSQFGVSRFMMNEKYINNVAADLYESKFVNNQYKSDYYLRNASFLKMDNLGLSFNAGRLSKSGTATLSISANCQNVFVISDYKGIDPEIFSGIDYNLYPRPRTYTLGVNVGF